VTLFKVRRTVDSHGFSPVTLGFADAAGVASSIHSAMATNERPPAITAGSGTDRRARSDAAGADGMSGNSSSSNWSTTVYLGDDDIGRSPWR
jgi:hypothetical protein